VVGEDITFGFDYIMYLWYCRHRNKDIVPPPKKQKIMKSIIVLLLLIVVFALLLISFVIRSFGNISCRRTQTRLKKDFKKNYNNLRNLLREYRVLVGIKNRVNKKKYSIFYDKNYWNEILDFHIDEISKQSFKLFNQKLYSINDYIDLQSFLNSISYNSGIKPGVIENFVKNYKNTLISEIVAKETLGYEGEQKSIFSETLINQITFSLQ